VSSGQWTQLKTIRIGIVKCTRKTDFASVTVTTQNVGQEQEEHGRNIETTVRNVESGRYENANYQDTQQPTKGECLTTSAKDETYRK